MTNEQFKFFCDTLLHLKKKLGSIFVDIVEGKIVLAISGGYFEIVNEGSLVALCENFILAGILSEDGSSNLFADGNEINP